MDNTFVGPCEFQRKLMKSCFNSKLYRGETQSPVFLHCLKSPKCVGSTLVRDFHPAISRYRSHYNTSFPVRPQVNVAVGWIVVPNHAVVTCVTNRSLKPGSVAILSCHTKIVPFKFIGMVAEKTSFFIVCEFGLSFGSVANAHLVWLANRVRRVFFHDAILWVADEWSPGTVFWVNELVWDFVGFGVVFWVLFASQTVFANIQAFRASTMAFIVGIDVTSVRTS